MAEHYARLVDRILNQLTDAGVENAGTTIVLSQAEVVDLTSILVFYEVADEIMPESVREEALAHGLVHMIMDLAEKHAQRHPKPEGNA